MNAPSPATPSPLVPQGSIPPRNTSRSGRVLLIALTVVAFHLAGLGVVLMQGCQKDTKTSGLGTETNNTALSYPAETNNSIFSPATNVAATPPRPVSNAATMGAMGTGAGNGLPPAAPTNVGLSAPLPGAGLAESPMAAPSTAATTATDVGATTEYKVVTGDSLGKIAARNKVTLTALNKANPNLDPKKLKVGQTIKIPVSAASTATSTASTASATGAGAATTTAAHAAPPIAGASGTYKVKSGDTLTKIAKANGITVSQLRAANKLKTSQLLAGQTLKIPARSAAAAPTESTTH
jgi:LysM repeat protein